ncbi:MAG: hypothetical protein QOG53_1895 [Frankiales bacterium]|jgi:dTDP-4-amino-4,6-dideoxygalactose transaminase|nr:hypothetical protein [Frankiales bacterium]
MGSHGQQDVIPYLDLRREMEYCSAALTEAIARVVQSGWFVLGREVESFEVEWADFVGRKHCIGVGNALDGLAITLRALGVGPGDEVLVPSNTYIATWLAVSACGAKPVPVEPEPGSFLVTVDAYEASITTRTVGLLPVHLYGELCDIASINACARRHALFVLDDAAQSHGARLDGVTPAGDAAVYSFYPTKNLGALGDAGAVVTDDAALAETVRVLRNYGSSAKYHHKVRGVNSRLDEMQAAVLKTKMPDLDARNRRRREVAQKYSHRFAGSAVAVPAVPADPESHVWHVYNVMTNQRDALEAHLKQVGIGTQIFYPVPPHLSPAYEDHNFEPQPWAERIARESLALPIGPYLADEEVELVIEGVLSFQP